MPVRNRPVQKCRLYNTSTPSSSFSCNNLTLSADVQNAPPRAAMRQTFALPNPNPRRLQNRRQGHALRTLGRVPWPSRPPRIQKQSACYLQELGLLTALPSRRGAPHVHFTSEQLMFVWRRRLRPARRGRAAALSPAHGAHFC